MLLNLFLLPKDSVDKFRQKLYKCPHPSCEYGINVTKIVLSLLTKHRPPSTSKQPVFRANEEKCSCQRNVRVCVWGFGWSWGGELRQCVRVMQVQRELVRDTGWHIAFQEGWGVRPRGQALLSMQAMKPPLPPCKGRELGHIRAWWPPGYSWQVRQDRMAWTYVSLKYFWAVHKERWVDAGSLLTPAAPGTGFWV